MTVYALKDAQGAIRYVGHTYLPLDLRLRGHRYPAKTDQRPIAKFMREHRATVTIEPLSEGFGREEFAWIRRLRDDGCDLLNIYPYRRPVPATLTSGAKPASSAVPA